MSLKPVSKSELNALLSLLDDKDPEVYEHVFQKLSSYGRDIIPDLENAWADTFNENMHERLEELIHRIQYEELYSDFERYCKEGVFDLVEGASLLCRFAYPDTELEQIQKTISTIKREIWIELNESLTPLEKINVLNQMFFQNMRFDITSAANIHDSDFFINKLFETHNAHPVLLGLLYIVLARKLDLPIYGLNLPNHFALVLCRSNVDITKSAQELKQEVIFYINIQQFGSIFTKNEIEEYIQKSELQNKPEFFAPCKDKQIIKLLLKNMLQYYISKNDEIRSRELSTLVSLML